MKSSLIHQLVKFNRGRDPVLLKLKFKRMKKSAFAFFRGADHLFATAWKDLKLSEAGPGVLSCGDLHLENFGIFSGDDGKVRFGINDFDEALVAPAAFDVVRCTASIFLAAEDWQLNPVQAAQMSLSFLSSYRNAVERAVQNTKTVGLILGQRKKTIFDLIKTHLGSQRQLLRTFTTASGKSLRLIRDKKHFKLGKHERDKVQIAVENLGQRLGRGPEYVALDAVGRVAGVGSLGVKRYCVLIEGHGGTKRRLLDVKAAQKNSVAFAVKNRQPDFQQNEALRAVIAQRELQGVVARGLEVIRLGANNFRVRDMIPDENRFVLDAFRNQPPLLIKAIEEAGSASGAAHVRGSRIDGQSTPQQLVEWVQGSFFEALLPAAVTIAAGTITQFEEFRNRSYMQLKKAIGKR